jgi:hypothetical protein
LIAGLVRNIKPKVCVEWVRTRLLGLSRRARFEEKWRRKLYAIDPIGRPIGTTPTQSRLFDHPENLLKVGVADFVEIVHKSPQSGIELDASD